MPRKKHPGIVKTAIGWRAYIRIRGELHSKRFPKTATLAEMQDWRAAIRTDTLRDLKRKADATPQPGTFAEDIETYLAAVKAMPTHNRRAEDVNAWLTVFDGARPRSSITSAEIRRALQQWRIDGRAIIKHDREPVTLKALRVIVGYGPLSESSCNHRRTALMHFFNVLNGKAGANPVRDVPKFREPDPEVRGVTLEQLQQVFDAMPETKTKARVLVMGLTGLPHSTLMRLTPAAVDYEAKTVTVPRRRKGKGTKPRVLPLTPEAVKAFQMLEQYDAWGKFSKDSLRGSLQRACKTAGVPKMRGYDLRHSFGTAVYRASGDIRAVQALLDHSDVKLTERYTLGAVDERMRVALKALAPGGNSVATFAGPKPPSRDVP